MSEPVRVILTEDFVDLLAGVGFREGTVLVRIPGGQYIQEGVISLGSECVTHYGLIEDISRPLPDGEGL